MTSSDPIVSRLTEALGRSVHLFGMQVNGNLSATSDWSVSALSRLPDIMGLFIDFTTTGATFTARLQAASYNGAVPMITWQSSKFGSTGDVYPLTGITAGNFDAAINDVAQAAAAWGQPFLLRFAHEMNASWYPWGNVNYTASDYIAAWQHVHDLFLAAGANNVKWVWCPNVASATKSPASYYPGDAYVDVIGLDGYNTSAQSKSWTWPEQVFSATVTNLQAYLATKPLIVCEAGCAEVSSTWPQYNGAGASKAQWITRFVQLMASTGTQGFCWSEWSGKQIETSQDSVNAMKTALYTYWA